MSRITGSVVYLPYDDLDTDQIIPAHFVTNFRLRGFSNALFANRRLDERFPLNFPDSQGATILVAGENFGCGSSREAAVWAIQQAGFVAVIAPSFGDIFAENAAHCGLVAAVVDRKEFCSLTQYYEKHRGDLVVLDVLSRTLTLSDGSVLNVFLSDKHLRAIESSANLMSNAVNRRNMVSDWLNRKDSIYGR